MTVLAIFGPTAVGKTGVAIEVAERLRERGEDPVAVSCDALQVYRGLETLTGAASASDRERLEHRLLAVASVSEEFSAGRFAALAHAQIDSLIAEGRRPIVVGGTGLYLQAALTDLDLQPPVPSELRAEVEADLADRGPEALHGELAPEIAAGVHPNDRKRVGRLTELARAGIAPPRGSDGLWTARLRHPTALFGVVVDREQLRERIDARVDAMAAAGAADEARRASAAGASRTARAALGFDAFAAGDVEAVKRAHRAYARRQLTWMRRMENVLLVDRTGRQDADVAREIVGALEER